MDTVIAKEMGIDLRRTQIIQRDDIKIITPRFRDGAQHQAADAPKTIDCDSNRHDAAPVSRFSRLVFAAATIAATVMPKWLNRVSKGALAPKPVMPRKTPSSPRYFSQPWLIPASMPILIASRGRSWLRYSCGWASKSKVDGSDTAR